jgi:WD40 repeat protein
MEKDPRRRFASADRVAEDLERWLKGEPISVRPVGRIEQGLMWCRRNPVVAGLTAAVAILLLAVALGSTVAAFRIAAARDAADSNARHAETARKNERIERERAMNRAEESRQRLVRLYVTNGARLQDVGDLSGALAWFAEALKHEQGNPVREDAHRVRLAAVLRQCPKLVQVWYQGKPINHAAFSPDGRRAVTASGQPLFLQGASGEAGIWDLDTGRPVIPPLRHDHDHPVWHASFSPDGRYVVTASGGNVDVGPRMVRTVGEARVWDTATGRQVSGPMKHEGEVKYAAFTADGRRIITATGQTGLPYFFEVRVWDAITGEPITHPFRPSPMGPHRQFHLSFSPDGHRVVIGGWMEARVWDVLKGEPVTPPLKHGGKQLGRGGWVGAIHHTAFSRDGRRVVTAAADGTARVWDAETGEPVTPPLPHADQVNHAAFSPDGHRVITASDDGTARVWDAATGRPISASLRHGARVTLASFGPDGRQVVTACADETVRVWDAATGRPVSPLLRHGDPVTLPVKDKSQITSVAFHPDGRRLIVASQDGTTRVWELATAGPEITPLQAIGGASRAAFSRDGRRALTIDWDWTARIWDLSKAGAEPITVPEKFSGYINYATFSPDGRRVVTANGTSPWGPFRGGDPEGHRLPHYGEARVWDAVTGRPITAPLKHQKFVYHASFSPDNRLVVTSSEDGTARVWDAAAGQPITPPLRHGDGVECASFSPDGHRIVTACIDGTARVWEAASGKPLTPPMKVGRALYHASFSPDGHHVLTAGYDREARLWDAASGQLVSPPVKHGGHLADVSFASETCRIAVILAQSARVWDVVKGEPVTPPLTHDGSIRDAAFSPDGRRVVTISHDGSARVWDVNNGDPLTPPLPHGISIQTSPGEANYNPHGHSDTPQASFGADNRRALTAGRNALQVWNLMPDDRPANDLILLAQVFSGHRIDATGGLVPLGAGELHATWQALKSKYVETFTSVTREILDWHRREAEDCEEHAEWTAAIWHLERLIEAVPTQTLNRARRARAQAEQFAQRSSADALRLNEASREVVRQPNAQPAAYLLALGRAEAASRINPQSGAYLNTLGVAQYRVGRFREALETLSRSEKLNTAALGRCDPSDLAFQAMAQHRLGQTETSRATLKRLREVMATRHAAANSENQTFLHEAEAVILYDPIFPADPFAH